MNVKFERLVVIPESQQQQLEMLVKSSEHVSVFNKQEISNGRSREMYYVPASAYTQLLKKLNELISMEEEKR